MPAGNWPDAVVAFTSTPPVPSTKSCSPSRGPRHPSMAARAATPAARTCCRKINSPTSSDLCLWTEHVIATRLHERLPCPDPPREQAEDLHVACRGAAQHGDDVTRHPAEHGQASCRLPDQSNPCKRFTRYSLPHDLDVESLPMGQTATACGCCCRREPEQHGFLAALETATGEDAARGGPFDRNGAPSFARVVLPHVLEGAPGDTQRLVSRRLHTPAPTVPTAHC